MQADVTDDVDQLHMYRIHLTRYQLYSWDTLMNFSLPTSEMSRPLKVVEKQPSCH
jgi:hypothetical protein